RCWRSAHRPEASPRAGRSRSARPDWVSAAGRVRSSLRHILTATGSRTLAADPASGVGSLYPADEPFSSPPMCRCLLFCLALVIVAAAADGADPPATGAAAPGQTKGLEDALRNLHAPLAGGDPL